MINKIILILLFIVSAVYSQQVFNSVEYSFEITFPDYMVVKKGNSENPAVHSSINQYTFINVNLQSDTSIGYKVMEDYYLEDFFAPIREMLEKEQPGYTLMDYGKTEIGSFVSFYIAYKCIKGSETIRVKQYFMIYKFKMYAITAVCLDAEAVEMEPMLNDCVNSFKFF